MLSDAVHRVSVLSTCLVELEELLFESFPLGLLAMSPEPLHPVSAPAGGRRGLRGPLTHAAGRKEVVRVVLVKSRHRQ